MGGDFAHRWTQTQEAILAMQALWTQEEAEYHGKYYDFPLVRSFPKPAQKPHPPIILGSITSRRVFQRIVAWGDGWMPVGVSLEEMKHGRETLNELAVQAGRDPRSIQVVAFLRPLTPKRSRLSRTRGRTPRSSRWRPRGNRRPWPNSRRSRRRSFPRLVGGYEPQQHRWVRAGADAHTGGGRQRACYDSKSLHRQLVYAKADTAVRVARLTSVPRLSAEERRIT